VLANKPSIVCTVQHILLHLKTPDMDLGTQGRYDYVLHMASDAHANVPDIVIQVMSKMELESGQNCVTQKH